MAERHSHTDRESRLAAVLMFGLGARLGDLELGRGQLLEAAAEFQDVLPGLPVNGSWPDLEEFKADQAAAIQNWLPGVGYSLRLRDIELACALALAADVTNPPEGKRSDEELVSLHWHGYFLKTLKWGSIRKKRRLLASAMAKYILGAIETDEGTSSQAAAKRRVPTASATQAATGSAVDSPTSSSMEESVRSWIANNLERLNSPPRHMRRLGLALTELRQDVYLIDPMEPQRNAASGPAIPWRDVVHPSSPRFRRTAIVVAGPGYGKSTLLALAATDAYQRLLASEHGLETEPFPVHATCSAVANHMNGTSSSPEAFATAVAEAAAADSFNGGEALRTFIRTKLLESSSLVLLDGLDEIEEPRPDTIERKTTFLDGLATFLTKSSNQLYLTSRSYDIPDLQSVPMDWFGLRGFSPDQIRTFACRVLGSTRGANFAESLDDRTRALAEIPVMLSFLCVLAAGQTDPTNPQTLPDRLFDLYAAVLKRLAEGTWRSTPRATRSREDLVALLPSVAWNLIRESWRAQFPAAELRSHAGADMAYTLREAGIVVPSGQTLQFLHPSFGEHLVAAHLASLDTPSLESEITTRMPDTSWDNVWPHLAGALVSRPPCSTYLIQELLAADRIETAGSCLVETRSAVDPSLVSVVIQRLVDQLGTDGFEASLGGAERHRRILRTVESLLDDAIEALIKTVTDRGPYRQRVAALTLLRNSSDPRVHAAIETASRSPVPSVSQAALAAASRSATAERLSANQSPDPAQGISRQSDEVPELAALIHAFLARRPRTDNRDGVEDHGVPLILRSYETAAAVCGGKVAVSGVPSLEERLAVARILAELGLDGFTVAASILRDAVQDPGGRESIARDFGPEVSAIASRVNQVEAVRLDSGEAQQAANARKMLLAIARDPHVLLIVLADQLQVMRTVAALPEWKQKRAAQETLDVYAPLAYRCGINEVQWQLEDLAFAALHPRRYAEIEQMVAIRAPEREDYLGERIEDVIELLDRAGVRAVVRGRSKHLYSIYETMIIKGREFDEVYDLVGLRILVDTAEDCWKSLEAIHARWPYVEGLLEDFISTPRYDLYQSLHTTIVGPGGKTVEIQIRTFEMHRHAELEASNPKRHHDAASGADWPWSQRIELALADSTDLVAYLERPRLELLSNEDVLLFTPRGDVLSLPPRSTPIDFAYAIDTSVGHRCVGARVNGKVVPLTLQLNTGDLVEILTTETILTGPTPEWLTIAVSPVAQRRIRRWISKNKKAAQDSLKPSGFST